MPENQTSMPEPSGESTSEVVAGKNDANVPETPAEPLGGVFVYPGDDDLAGIPVPPIASPGGRPVYPGDDDLAGIPTTPVAPSGGRPVYPDNTIGHPGFPTISFPVTYPTVSGGNYYSRVRFLMPAHQAVLWMSISMAGISFPVPSLPRSLLISA